MPYQVEMAQATRQKLSPMDFVFPKERKWPIQDIEQAKIALTWAKWPQQKKVAKKVRDAVYKRYPQLKKRSKKNESLGTLGSIDSVRNRLEAMKSLLGERDNHVTDPESVAAVFNKENDTSEPKPLMEKPVEEGYIKLGGSKADMLDKYIDKGAKGAQDIKQLLRIVDALKRKLNKMSPKPDTKVYNSVIMAIKYLEQSDKATQNAWRYLNYLKKILR